MKNVEERSEKNIDEIISIVKLASLLFCGIIAYKIFFMRNKFIANVKNGYANIIPSGFFVAVLLIIYWIWSAFSKKSFQYKDKRGLQIIENFIYIFIFSVLIFFEHTYVLEYKFLFLFIIITSTLQLGMKQGLLMAVISSAVILIMDLVFLPSTGGMNLHFENDLIIAGVFVLTAYPLGYYVEIEKRNIERKNLKIEELGNELRRQDEKRKDIEEKLLKNQACYNLLIENSRDSILVHRDYKLIFVNESAAKLLGFKSAEELVDQSIFDMIPIEERNDVEEIFQQIYDKKTNIQFFEGKLMKCDGEVVAVKSTSTYFVYEGKSTILSIVSDITSEKQVEELRVDVEKNIQLLKETREFNRLITDFFTNISHELKTPLNVIYSAIQVLNLHKSSEQEIVNRQDQYIKVIKQNCYRLTRLINNLLDLSRLDAGFLKLNLGTYNIISVVEDITLSVVEYAKSKRITIIFDTEIEEKIMSFDPDKIERILLNLLSNAIKFTGAEGQIFVNIKDREATVVISVEDTGLGIPEGQLEVIFERFRQVDRTLKREHEGSGIGLSLVKSFVEMHGGTVTVRSKLGSGSEFVVQLPTKEVEKENIEESSFYETNVERTNVEFSDIYY